MNEIEKTCLELCKEFIYTSSITDKTILNYSVKLVPDEKANVILDTKEDKYSFVLNLPKEDYISHSKCISGNGYNIESIQIKGFDAAEFGNKVDLKYLWVILDMLAEGHARCLEDNNLQKKNYTTDSLSVEKKLQPEPFLEILEKIINEANEENLDRSVLIKGINRIEDSWKILKLEKDCAFVYANILHNKLFVKRSGTSLDHYKILNIRTEQMVPLVYDLLMTVFSFTDQNMRQHHFHELLQYYYESLKKELQKLSLDVVRYLPLTNFKEQINKCLPYVKLEVSKLLCQTLMKGKYCIHGKLNVNNLEQYETISTAILEVNESILYPNLHREDCYTIIKNKLGSSDYILLNYRLIPLQEREGFLGDYFKLKIDLEYEGEVKLFHLFAKYLPTYSDLAIDLATGSFKKEEFYYLNFIPELNNFGLGDITNFLPNCYFSRTNEVLIFEDLIMENYRTFPVRVAYTYEMLLITIKQLAKVHASSLLYEELSSKKANEIVRLDEKHPQFVEEKNVLNTKETLTKKAYDCAIRTFLDMLNVFPEIPKNFSIDEFKRRAKIAFDLCFEKVKKSDKFRNVLCQGDCWASNILFKTDEDNLPTDCRLVDYQLTRYCPPGHDIYFLLFMATTKETRRKFESKLLQEYYSELSNILQRYQVDPQEIYTYQQFLDCCNYMKSQALCHAAIVLQFVLFPKEKLKTILIDKNRTEEIFYMNRDIFIKELQYGGVYGQRMKDLVEDMYDVCENIFL